MRLLLKVLLVFSLLVPFSVEVHAQTVAQPTPMSNEAPIDGEKGAFFKNLQGAAKAFASRFNEKTGDSLAAVGMGYANTLVKPALSVAGALALMYLFYEVLQFMGGKNGSMLTVLFDVGVPAVVTAMLIANYETNMGMFNGLLDLFRNLGGGNPTGKIMQFYGTILNMISIAISNSYHSLAASISLTNFSASNIASSIADLFMTVIFALVILVIVFSSMAEVIGLLLLGPFLFAVGSAFGPLMLAGLVTPWTRDYVGKWIGFIVGSAVVTGVLTIVISIATTIFLGLGFNEYVKGDPSAATMAMAAILVMSVNALISQAPGIASALIPGSIGASKGGGSDVTKGAQKVARQHSKDLAKTTGGMGLTGLKKGGSYTMNKTKGLINKLRGK